MVGLGGGVGRARALAVGLSCYLVIFCMYVFRGFRPALGVGGAMLPVAVDGSPWFLPCLCGVVWPGSVVCWFCIVYFGVDFIWEDGGSVASSLLVWAILLFVTNFTRVIVTSSLLFFLFMSFYLWLL